MTRFALQAWAGKQKAAYPDKYCPMKGCLWKTGGGYCPRHQPKEQHGNLKDHQSNV